MVKSFSQTNHTWTMKLESLLLVMVFVRIGTGTELSYGTIISHGGTTEIGSFVSLDLMFK